MLISFLYVAVGLILLMGASDRFVEAAVRLARALGVSIVLIGALIVGLGTSLPELLVSVIAGADGKVDVAMANVTGSNVANVTLVLGTAAIAAPIMSRTRILRREGVLMFFAVSALAGVLWDGEISRIEGGGLLLGMAVALVLLIRWSATDVDGIIELEEGQEAHSVPGELLIGLAALAVTVFAARLLLDGALDLGERFGFGEAFLGVLLGIGTSLPELATTMAAVRRHESDLVIGNVLGSNLFNSLAVAGSAAVVGPGVLADLARPSLVIMIGVVVLAGWFAWGDQKVSRKEGIALLAVFLVFTALSY
ncbi:MAG: sodium:calcium antiporter [bacterium]|nr:sodium:calcium antiporter [bacterium]MCP4968051.1 sodium:calcium antiporter [bacterium]